MSERLGAITESWRPQRRTTGFDPQMRRLAAIAGAVLCVAALAVGGYTLMARQPRTIPVIEADSRPVRVRPDNPGGMQVAGADEQIMGGSGTGQTDAMAPAAEAPRLGALRAQIEAARQPPPDAAPPPAQPVALAVPPPASATPAAPEPRPAVAARGVPAAPAPVLGGGTQVQLAAVGSEQAAMAEWQRLAKRAPELLAARQPAVQRAERDGKAVWRLRTGGFADTAQATAFCNQARAKGLGCSIASF